MPPVAVIGLDTHTADCKDRSACTPLDEGAVHVPACHMTNIPLSATPSRHSASHAAGVRKMLSACCQMCSAVHSSRGCRVQDAWSSLPHEALHLPFLAAGLKGPIVTIVLFAQRDPSEAACLTRKSNVSLRARSARIAMAHEPAARLHVVLEEATCHMTLGSRCTGTAHRQSRDLDMLMAPPEAASAVHMLEQGSALRKHRPPCRPSSGCCA